MSGASLWLATVVIDVAGQHDPADDLLVARALMEVPEVVSVRPDGGVGRWLYRVDVEGGGQGREELAAAPARVLGIRLGLVVTVVGVEWLSPQGRRALHARFTRSRR